MTALQQLFSFAHGQEQRLVLGEQLLWWHLLVCGVLQGEILFLMLFNIYMCPLTKIAQGQEYSLCCHQHAYDTQLYLLINRWTDSTSGVLEGALKAMAGCASQCLGILSHSLQQQLHLDLDLFPHARICILLGLIRIPSSDMAKGLM